jgi:hypothetical protein
MLNYFRIRFDFCTNIKIKLYMQKTLNVSCRTAIHHLLKSENFQSNSARRFSRKRRSGSCRAIANAC